MSLLHKHASATASAQRDLSIIAECVDSVVFCARVVREHGTPGHDNGPLSYEQKIAQLLESVDRLKRNLNAAT